jgi:hypothetical protein
MTQVLKRRDSCQLGPPVTAFVALDRERGTGPNTFSATIATPKGLSPSAGRPGNHHPVDVDHKGPAGAVLLGLACGLPGTNRGFPNTVLAGDGLGHAPGQSTAHVTVRGWPPQSDTGDALCRGPTPR